MLLAKESIVWLENNILRLRDSLAAFSEFEIIVSTRIAWQQVVRVTISRSKRLLVTAESIDSNKNLYISCFLLNFFFLQRHWKLLLLYYSR